jgi:hypothetical protein
VESPALSDIEAQHWKDIGLSEDGVCRKTFVPYETKADEEARTVKFVITTGAIDRDGDTIKVEGWDVKNWLKAGAPILWGHDGSQYPVAAGKALVKSGGALHATAQFPPAGVSERSDTLFNLIRTIGVPGATSVGFMPKKGKYAWNEERGGIDFEEQELLEFSIVSIPSNPEAVMRMSKDFAKAAASGVDLEPIRKALALIEAPEPAIEKAGRRLSAKTEASLKSARTSVDEAAKHLKDVLAEAEEEIEDAGKSAPVLMVVPNPAPPMFLVNPKDVQAAVAAVVSEQVKSAVNRARGRLD